MTTFRQILLLSALLALTGCATMQPKTIRDPFETAPVAKPSYDEFKLMANGDVFLGMTFAQGNAPDKYVAPQIAAITKASEETKKRYDSGSTNSLIGGVFGGVGGFCVGWTIGASIGKQWTSANSYVLAAGGGSLILSYLFSSLATNDYRAAVDSYNTRLLSMQ